MGQPPLALKISICTLSYHSQSFGMFSSKLFLHWEKSLTLWLTLPDQSYLWICHKSPTGLLILNSNLECLMWLPYMTWRLSMQPSKRGQALPQVILYLWLDNCWRQKPLLLDIVGEWKYLMQWCYRLPWDKVGHDLVPNHWTFWCTVWLCTLTCHGVGQWWHLYGDCSWDIWDLSEAGWMREMNWCLCDPCFKNGKFDVPETTVGCLVPCWVVFKNMEALKVATRV